MRLDATFPRIRMIIIIVTHFETTVPMNKIT